MIKICKMEKLQAPQVTLVDEDRFFQEMRQRVEPFLTGHKVKGYMGKLYYELYPLKEARGTIVICHGYTESCEKWHEMISYFLQAGYQTAIMDQRGHGHSMRLTGNPNLVHVDRFDDYVEDLHRFVHEVVMEKMAVDQNRLFLLGHSMGGCVSVRYLEKNRDDFAGAVFNAPMLGINFGSLPLSAARMICVSQIALGRGKQHISGQKDFDPRPDFDHCSASSRPRYDYYHQLRIEEPDYRTSFATYRWGYEAIQAGLKAVRDAGKVSCPFLMIIAGKDNLVSREAQEEFLKKAENGRALLMEDSRHETFRAPNEQLAMYLQNVLAFFEEC